MPPSKKRRKHRKTKKVRKVKIAKDITNKQILKWLKKVPKSTSSASVVINKPRRAKKADTVPISKNSDVISMVNTMTDLNKLSRMAQMRDEIRKLTLQATNDYKTQKIAELENALKKLDKQVVKNDEMKRLIDARINEMNSTINFIQQEKADINKTLIPHRVVDLNPEIKYEQERNAPNPAEEQDISNIIQGYNPSAKEGGPNLRRIKKSFHDSIFGNKEKKDSDTTGMAVVDEYPNDFVEEEQVSGTKGSGNDDKDALYDYEIDEMMKDWEPLYLGTIAGDEINEIDENEILENGSGGWIMNLSDRDDPNGGTHWIAIYIRTGVADGELDYFDPLAQAIPPSFNIQLKELVDRLYLPYMLKFKQNFIQHQSVKSSDCGYHCMKCLEMLFSGKSWAEASGYEDFIKDKSEKYEKEIKEYIKYDFI